MWRAISCSVVHAQLAIRCAQSVAKAQTQVLEQFDFRIGMRDAEALEIFQAQDVTLHVGVRDDHTDVLLSFLAARFPRGTKRVC